MKPVMGGEKEGIRPDSRKEERGKRDDRTTARNHPTFSRAHNPNPAPAVAEN
jgi:hypothetical protein